MTWVPGAHILPGAHPALAHHAVHRCDDLGVAEIDLGQIADRPLRLGLAP